MAVAVLGLCGIATVSIQAEDVGEKYPPIVEKLAERFNLDTGEVKEFFDKNREERMQERLAEAGITEEQLQALKAKKQELREECGALRGEDISFEEKKARMQEMKEMMKAWAEENEIDLSVFKKFGSKYGKGYRPFSK